jgi:hypothetical protein
VSRRGIPVLISQVPSDFNGWLVDGDFPDDDGWQGLPKQLGLYECRMSVRFRFDEPELKAVSCKPMTAIIDMVQV